MLLPRNPRESEAKADQRRKELHNNLKKIVEHRRCGERVRIFGRPSGPRGEDDDGPDETDKDFLYESAFDRFLLKAIVRSIAQDVEQTMAARARAGLTHDSRGGRQALFAHSLHDICRADDRASTGYSVKRVRVPDEKVAWAVHWPEYDAPDGEVRPKEYTDRIVLDPSTKWADPQDPTVIDWAARMAEDQAEPYSFEPDTQRPMNPHGRCGLRGRGSHGKWGPNFATDPLVTRESPLTRGTKNDPKYQMLVMLRPKELRLGIPGYIGKTSPVGPLGPKLHKSFDHVKNMIRKEHTEAEAAYAL